MKTWILFLVLVFSNLLWGQPPRLVLPVGHTGKINAIDIDKSLKYMLTASSDGKVKLTDVKWGTTLINFEKHLDEVNSVMFSKDGDMFLTASSDSMVYLVETKSGNILKTFHHSDPVKRASFNSRNTEVLVLSSNGWNISVWDLEKNNISCRIRRNMEDAEFSPNGQQIVTSSGKQLLLWDTKSGALLKAFTGHKSPVKSVHFDPLGKWLVSSAENCIIWDVETGGVHKILNGHTAELNNAVFNHTSTLVATSSEDGSCKVWNPQTGFMVTNIDGFDHWVEEVVFSPVSDEILIRVAARTGSPELFTYNAVTGIKTATIINSINNVNTAVFSPTGKTVIAGLYGGSVYAWDARTGLLTADFSGLAKPTGSVSLHPNGRFIITCDGDGLVRVWDSKSGQLIRVLNDTFGSIEKAQLHPGGKYLLTCGYSKRVDLWDTEKYTKIYSFNAEDGYIYTCKFSEDGNSIIVNTGNFKSFIWDVKTGDKLQEFHHKSILHHVIYNKFNNTLLTCGFGGSPEGMDVSLWDVKTGNFIRQCNDGDKMNQNTSVDLSQDGLYLLVATNSSICTIWKSDLTEKVFETGAGIYMRKAEFIPNSNCISVLTNHTFQVWNWRENRKIFENRNIGKSAGTRFDDLFTSPTGKSLIISRMDGTADLIRIIGDSVETRLTFHLNATIRYLSFQKDDSLAIISSSDNTYKIINLISGKILCSFIPLFYNDYLTITPRGYFRATSAAAGQLYYVTNNLNIITFEQLDVKYNRPDMVLEALENSDSALINSYKKAYIKRILKLGLDTTIDTKKYSLPVIDIVNRKVIDLQQKQDFIMLEVKGMDSIYNLEKFNIWINDIPMFGVRGINLRSRRSRQFDTILRISLVDGFNRIETSILNENGTESYKIPLFVNYSPEIKKKYKVYFIGIGIDKFANADYNLNYSGKDIRDLADSLKNRYRDTLEIYTLLNEKVTIKNVEALKRKLLKTNINDKVIVAYSGHGLLSKDFDYYLSTYTVDFEHPEVNGLPYEALENLLDSIPARQKLMLIDACHSGEVDKDELVRIRRAADSLGLKGVDVVAYEGNESGLGLQNSFELMQELFVNVGKGTGATIISASGGTQFALEKGDLKNGVFTYSILEAMKNNPTMTVSQLKYIVGKRVVELTNGMQKPTSRNETINSDWRVW